MKSNNRYKIKTPLGFQSFGGIRKLKKDTHYTIELSNGKIIKCSDNHPFIYDGKEIHSNELEIGSCLDSVNSDSVFVKSIDKIHKDIDLYDIVEVDNGNIFNVDGIVSHNCDFISSGNTVVPGTVLQWFKEQHVKEPVEKRGMDSNYWIWEYPDYTKDYIIAADVARGDGKDYSAFHILEVESMKQIASYKGQIDTKQFGRMLVNVGREWNDGLVVVENANVGWAVLQEMIDMNYPNIFYSSADMQVVDTHYTHINKKQPDFDNPTKPGFTTSTKTRPMLISKLDEYVRKKDVIIQDSRLIDELFTFIWTGTRAQAMNGYNDDLVMSYCIALWVRDTALRLRMEGIEMTKQSLNHIQKHTGVYTNSDSDKNNPYKMKIKGEDVDLRWLFD